MDTYTLYVPFEVEASSERVAVLKLENALGRALPTVPCLNKDHCDCVTDDPFVIASTWDIPIPAAALGQE